MDRRELGDGLALRTFEEADADELLALIDRNRAHLAPWMPWLDAHRTREDSLRFVRESHEHLHVGDEAELAIVEQERIVGVASLIAIDAEAGTCRCGYWVAADREGRGIVARAVASLLAHAFSERGLRQVELRIAPHNARSRHVAERLGFHCAGPIDGTVLFGERWAEQLQYLLLAEEWRAAGRAG